MNKQTFYAWLLEVPKTQFNRPEIQSIVEFLRAQVVRLRLEEYRKWLVQHQFTVPDNISGVVSGHETLQQLTGVGLAARRWRQRASMMAQDEHQSLSTNAEGDHPTFVTEPPQQAINLTGSEP